MREIKFRGKRIDNGEWVYGNLVTYFNKPSIQDYSQTNGEIFSVDPETVDQYTGLQDKHGNDIYEGDIFVDNSYGEDVGQLIDSVIWNNETGAWVWGKDEVALVAESVDTIMVIGNIYDNPNLLEG